MVTSKPGNGNNSFAGIKTGNDISTCMLIDG